MSHPHTPRRPRSLAGKAAIVTGAGSAGTGIGNGRASAILLAEDGCAVLCVDQDAALAAATVDMIASAASDDPSFGPAAACAADVSSPAECERVVHAALRRFGRVDILVNNVGILGAPGDATAVAPDGWDRGMRVNVASMVWMAKHAVPAMLRNDPAGGSVVNVGSVAGLGGGQRDLLYPVSKGAVVNLTRSMAWQHGPAGVRVNCVCPGG
ncbi:hypothetical protein SLS56_008955 [Neofusicoccum ribis]|uniref:Uncharacterized protein n=1 Tax=Neofusicoccum ribis TaxID=45134 RepID=A0ABR3SIQ7_9PEZI